MPWRRRADPTATTARGLASQISTILPSWLPESLRTCHGMPDCGARTDDAATIASYTRRARHRSTILNRFPMPVPLLDLIVLGVVVISALLAAVRGFTRE